MTLPHDQYLTLKHSSPVSLLRGSCVAAASYSVFEPHQIFSTSPAPSAFSGPCRCFRGTEPPERDPRKAPGKTQGALSGGADKSAASIAPWWSRSSRDTPRAGYQGQVVRSEVCSQSGKALLILLHTTSTASKRGVMSGFFVVKK